MVRRAKDLGETIKGEKDTRSKRLKKAVAEQPAMDAVASTASPNASMHFPNKLTRTGGLAKRSWIGIRKNCVQTRSSKNKSKSWRSRRSSQRMRAPRRNLIDSDGRWERLEESGPLSGFKGAPQLHLQCSSTR